MSNNKSKTVTQSISKTSVKVDVASKMNRADVAKIARVKIKKAYKLKLAELDQHISDAETVIREQRDELEVVITDHVKKAFGDKLDKIKSIYLEEAKAIQKLFRANSDLLEKAAEPLFPNSFNLLSDLRLSEPRLSNPPCSYSHRLDGKNIIVTLSVGNASSEHETKVPKAATDLKASRAKVTTNLETLKAERSALNTRLNDPDLADEIEVELAQVDLKGTEIGQDYLKALDAFAMSETKLLN